MSNLLKTELYKLFHSWYFWGIGIFNLLLSSILLLDSKECSSNLIMASLYNIPLLYFLIIVFIALFIGSDFSGRTLNTYITAGHKRSSIFRVKLIVSQIGCIIILVFPLFVHGIISQFYIGEKLFWNDSTYTMVFLTTPVGPQAANMEYVTRYNRVIRFFLICHSDQFIQTSFRVLCSEIYSVLNWASECSKMPVCCM